VQREQAVLRHQGQAGEALAFVAWPGPDFHSNPRQARTGLISALQIYKEISLFELLTHFDGSGPLPIAPAVPLRFDPVPRDPTRATICDADPLGCSPHLRGLRLTPLP
jgi:hypothetical protein